MLIMHCHGTSPTMTQKAYELFSTKSTASQRDIACQGRQLTAANALYDALVDVVLREQVLIDGQDGASLPDVVIQLLHLGLDLQTAHNIA